MEALRSILYSLSSVSTSNLRICRFQRSSTFHLIILRRFTGAFILWVVSFACALSLASLWVFAVSLLLASNCASSDWGTNISLTAAVSQGCRRANNSLSVSPTDNAGDDMLLGIWSLHLCLIILQVFDLQMLVKTTLRTIHRDSSNVRASIRFHSGLAFKSQAKRLIWIDVAANLPITLGTIFNWTAIMSLYFICCSAMALSPFICDVKGHSEGGFVSLSICLYTSDKKRS